MFCIKTRNYSHVLITCSYLLHEVINFHCKMNEISTCSLSTLSKFHSCQCFEILDLHFRPSRFVHLLGPSGLPFWTLGIPICPPLGSHLVPLGHSGLPFGASGIHLVHRGSHSPSPPPPLRTLMAPFGFPFDPSGLSFGPCGFTFGASGFCLDTRASHVAPAGFHSKPSNLPSPSNSSFQPLQHFERFQLSNLSLK